MEPNIFYYILGLVAAAAPGAFVFGLLAGRGMAWRAGLAEGKKLAVMAFQLSREQEPTGEVDALDAEDDDTEPETTC